jgi:hypothetical protein
MTDDEPETGNSDNLRPAPSERGELIEAMRRFALDGFLIADAGTKDDFDKMWREAFAAE